MTDAHSFHRPEANPSRIARLRNRAFKVDIVFLFCAIIIPTVLAVTTFSYHQNSKAALEMTHDLVKKITDSVMEATMNYLRPAQIYSEITANVMAYAPADLSTAPHLDRYLMGVVRSRPHISLAYYGTDQGIRLGFDYQNVAGIDHTTLTGRGKAHFVSHQPDDLGAASGIIQKRFNFPKREARGLAPLLDAGFGKIGFRIETFRRGLLSDGNEPPADERHKEDAGGGHRQTHRRKVKHGEIASAVLGAEARYNQIGRRSDHGGHAAQDRAEGQGHEDAPGGGSPGARQPAGLSAS